MELVKEGLISKIRNRDTVLGAVIPKILGVLRAKGSKLHGFGGCSVQLTDDIVLSANRLGRERVMLSVYDVVNSEIAKVFSAHVNDDPGGFDRAFFRYQGGRAAILSWRRGNMGRRRHGRPFLFTAYPRCVSSRSVRDNGGRLDFK
jgi:hypothetical protein